MAEPTKYSARANRIRECQRIGARASGSAARALHALLSFIDADGYCWPLASTLERVTQLWRSNLFSALAELESLGIIDRRMLVSRVNGRNAPTLYRVGGRITGLPKNAERYILASKRKPKSRVVKRVRSPQNTDVATKPRSPQNADGGSPRITDGGSPHITDTEVIREVAAPIEQADARKRRPPSEAPAKSDDADRSEEVTPAPAKTPQGVPFPDPNERERQRIEKLKATALAKIKAEFKNRFFDDFILMAFEMFDQRAVEPIHSAAYYETAFRNEFNSVDRPSARTIESEKELRVGGRGPDIPHNPNYVPPPACGVCGQTERFHQKSLHQKKHSYNLGNGKWVEHDFVGGLPADIPSNDSTAERLPLRISKAQRA